MTKLMPVPDVGNDKFPDAKRYMDKGYHRFLYRFSPDDYKEMGKIWNGSAVDGGDREVVDGPPEGDPMLDLEQLPQEFAPGVSAEDVDEIARRIGAS